MNKKRAAITGAIFFLVQSLLPLDVSSQEPSMLSPETKVSLNNPDVCFRQLYSVLRLGLSIYEEDAIGRCPKEILIKKYGATLLGSKVQFDLEHIDHGKKGWTRYYPFSVDGTFFIARIFLTEERTYQPELPVLFEMSIKYPPVTFQVLPGINDIIKSRSVRPCTVEHNSAAVRSL